MERALSNVKRRRTEEIKAFSSAAADVSLLQRAEPQLCVSTCGTPLRSLPTVRRAGPQVRQAESKQSHPAVCVAIQASLKAKDLCAGVPTNITDKRLKGPNQRLASP